MSQRNCNNKRPCTFSCPGNSPSCGFPCILDACTSDFFSNCKSFRQATQKYKTKRNCSGINLCRLTIVSRHESNQPPISHYTQYNYLLTSQPNRESFHFFQLCFIKDPETDAEPKCCDKTPNQRHPACWPVEIPTEDPFYSNFGRRCMEFVRSGSGLTENCKLGLFPMTHTKKET
jgi:hypothetical protein